MMHHILKIADSKGLVIQFHTGLLEGNGNYINNSDPSLLNNLFFKYPNTTFDIFHIGYPYQTKLAALGKMFPNVFIDMCWAHIISPFASRQALSDYLDTVPYTKISAFGGDYLFVDGVYGHLQLAKENVSRVLSEKVSEGVFDIDRALLIARNLFYDNPLRIFRISDIEQ
jgi:predicted TIM-barrel fold metal-dependent hydrolase